ncbi:lysozyme C-1-like [Cetorhinus maximus]
MKILVVLSLLFMVTSGKVYEKCELARILKDKGLDGFHRHSLANWICMVETESGFNTNLTRHYRNLGIITSTNYGIFQINNMEWCDNGMATFSYNLCQISCNSLLDDDITDDIQCIKSVVVTQLGMDIWPGWKKNCLGRDHSHFLDDCQL